MVRIAAGVLFKMMVVFPLHADAIGDITELKGYGQVLRDEPYPAILDFDINSYDDIRTRAGRIAITFLDDSVVRLTEHSQLYIDEYIYDPNPSNSKMALQFASGTIRFVSGKLNKNNLSINTPSSQIAVRGTDFTVTVNEIGEALIILLPDEYGDASGEIVVSTALGQAILNKPYQATTTSVYEKPPTTPVQLDITLEFIDNLLIISPPKEEPIIAEDSTQSAKDYLDFNELDVDFLDEDFLEEEEDLDFSEVDIDYLNVNFFEDLLDVLDLLNEENEEQLLNQVSGVIVEGTQIGQDLETNITTIIEGSQIKLMRTVNQNTQLILNSDQSYTVIFIQDGVSKTVKINGASSSNITIIQGSG